MGLSMDLNKIKSRRLQLQIWGKEKRFAWKVSEEVKKTIDDESEPAGDFLRCYVTSRKRNSSFLMPPT